MAQVLQTTKSLINIPTLSQLVLPEESVSSRQNQTGGALLSWRKTPVECHGTPVECGFCCVVVDTSARVPPLGL